MMSDVTLPDVKVEIKTEEDILVPELIGTEIKKEEDDSFVYPGGFTCTTCKIWCVNEDTFIEHIRQHPITSTSQDNDPLSQFDYGHRKSQSREKPHKCSECFYSTREKSNIIRHQRIHSGEKPFKCTECSYSGRTKSHLVDHQRTHSGEKPFKCPDCAYSARRKSHLVCHQKTHK